MKLRSARQEERLEQLILSALNTHSHPDDFFRTLFENAPLGIAIGGSDTRLKKANPAFCKMLGYEESELIGKTFYDFTHPDDLVRSEGMKEQVLVQRADTHVSYLKRLIRKDGEVVLVRVTNSAVFRKDGSLLYSCGMAEDVTRQNHLEHLQAQLAAIVESSSDAIISLNLDGMILTWNKSAERTYGYTAEEAIGKSYVMLADLSDPGSAGFFDAVEMAKERQSSTNLEAIHRCKEARMIPVSLSISPVMNQFKKVEGISMIVRDVTSYKEALNALHRSEREMRETSANLARANKELEQFAFIASHDLQEPLRTICCYLQMFEKRYKGKIDQDSDEYLQFVIDGAKRMRDLIQDLLHFSRTAKQRKATRKISIQEVVEQVKRNLRGIIESSGAEISVQNMPTIMYDESLLVQVFQNLISNAIKFRGQEPPKIDVCVAKNATHYIFSVKDNGIGFSDEYRDRIFLIFQRLHTRDEYPGTGVGLAICKKIVENSGGQIWAESKLGKGSTFSFSIPITSRVGGGEA